MYPLTSSGRAAKSASVNGSTSAGSDLGLQALQVDVPIARHTDGQGLARAVRVAYPDHDVLQRVAAAHGRSARRRSSRALRRSTKVAIVGVSGVSITTAGGVSSYGWSGGTGTRTASTLAA